MIVTEFGPLRSEFVLLIVPPWVHNPTVMPRQDGVDLLEIRLSRRYPQEQWLIMPIAGLPRTLTTFRLLAGGQLLGDPSNVQFEVYVPLEVFTDFIVLPLLQSY
jgi:hypothetical protein